MPDKLKVDGELIVGSLFPPRSSEVFTGIVLQQSPLDIENNWEPLASYLEQETGLSVTVKTTYSIPIFEERCREGKYDMSYMNPYHYVVFGQSNGYKAIAKQNEKRIQGIMVMQKKDSEAPLSDLVDAKLVFLSSATFAASLPTQTHLSNEDISFEPVYVRSHDSIYRSVATGGGPTEVGVKRTVDETDPDIEEKLHVAWTTEKCISHTFAVQPRMSPNDIQKTQEPLVELDDPSKYISILHFLRFKGWVRAVDEDWDEVHALVLNDVMIEEK